MVLLVLAYAIKGLRISFRCEKMRFAIFVSSASALYNQEFDGSCNAPTTLDFEKLKFIPCKWIQ